MINGRSVEQAALSIEPNLPKPVAVVWDASIGDNGGYALATTASFSGVTVDVDLNPTATVVVGDGVFIGDQGNEHANVSVVDIDNGGGTQWGLSATIADAEGNYLGMTDVGGDIGANVHILDDPVGYTLAIDSYNMKQYMPSVVNLSTVTMAGGVEQLSAQALTNGVDLKNDKDNAATIWVGFDATVAVDTGYPLYPGESKVFEVDNLDKLWIFGTVSELLHIDASSSV